MRCVPPAYARRTLIGSGAAIRGSALLVPGALLDFQIKELRFITPALLLHVSRTTTPVGRSLVSSPSLAPPFMLPLLHLLSLAMQ